MDRNLIEGVSVIYQSAIRIAPDKVIYFDPLGIKEETHDADIIFITHDHHDHFSPEDIYKVRKADTQIIVPEKLEERSWKLGFAPENVHTVAAGQVKELAGLTVEAVPAYNNVKSFHPKESGWVGYVVTVNGVRYYIAGDTDMTEENRKVRCDVAFVPIGGTYTMDPEEAAEFVNTIKPRIAVPIHYGSIVGKKEDAGEFQGHLSPDIDCECLMQF